MVIKTRSIPSSRFKNLIDYVIKQEKEHIFLAADGVNAESVNAMKEDFALYKNDRVKNAYISTVISPSSEDKLSLPEMKNLLFEVQKTLGLDNRQFYAVIHNNTNTPHIHLVSNRIDYNEKVWNDHHVAWKCQKACLDICANLKLTSAYEKTGTYKGKGKSKKSVYFATREDQILKIRALFREIKYSVTSIDEVYEQLKLKGVLVEIEKFKNGLIGVTFQSEGYTIKASSVDRLLTLRPLNDTYCANDKMEAILDRNQARQTGFRTDLEIRREMSENPKNKAELKNEFQAYLRETKLKLNGHSKRSFDEENDKKRDAKLGRRKFELGLKIQL